jgi:hypothetical protein
MEDLIKKSSTTNDLRLKLKNFSSTSTKVLEIAPYHSPLFQKVNYKSFDVYDKNELNEMCKNDQLTTDCSKIKTVDFVDKRGDLTVINELFNVVASSHCIEHTTDIILHLINVNKLLETGGIYICFIPHRLYCFDHYKTPKSAADMIEAFITKRQRPTLKTFLETTLYTTHNDPSLHWKQKNGPWNSFDENTINQTINEYFQKEKDEIYTSLHNWQFTLQEFQCCFSILKQLNFIKELSILKSIDVSPGSHEFCVIFTKIT